MLFSSAYIMLDYNYFLSFFSSAFVAGFSSVLLSGLIIPFTVSPIGSLSNTPRLGATVFTNVFRKLLVPPFPPSNTVIFPRFMCSNAFTCSPAISFHWSTILYWIAIAGFDSAALTIASKPSASASNDFFLPSASASSFNWIAFASASACAKVAFARASASRVIFSAMAFACRIASCLAISAGTILVLRQIWWYFFYCE